MNNYCLTENEYDMEAIIDLAAGLNPRAYLMVAIRKAVDEIDEDNQEISFFLELRSSFFNQLK